MMAVALVIVTKRIVAGMSGMIVSLMSGLEVSHPLINSC